MRAMCTPGLGHARGAGDPGRHRTAQQPVIHSSHEVTPGSQEIHNVLRWMLCCLRAERATWHLLLDRRAKFTVSMGLNLFFFSFFDINPIFACEDEVDVVLARPRAQVKPPPNKRLCVSVCL